MGVPVDQEVLLTGLSGAGRTRGCIYLDDVSLEEINLERWCLPVGDIRQEPTSFRGGILTSVGLGEKRTYEATIQPSMSLRAAENSSGPIQ